MKVIEVNRLGRLIITRFQKGLMRFSQLDQFPLLLVVELEQVQIQHMVRRLSFGLHDRGLGQTVVVVWVFCLGLGRWDFEGLDPPDVQVNLVYHFC